MRVLFIGGTGNISSACTRRALEKNLEVIHLNRGTRPEKAPHGVTTLRADIRNADEVRRALGGMRFDSVIQWLGYLPEHVEADIARFRDRTAQYVFISSASAYRKPLAHPVITESTPLGNPFWEYSQHKISCERLLERAWEDSRFPYTVVRPSHTYDDGWIPTCFGSKDYTAARRILDGKEIVVPGDGQSLWTLTHASDFARGFIGLLGNPTAIGQAFHITSDEFLTWETIHETIGLALGARPRIVHVPSDFVARVCPERGKSLLGDKAHSAIFDNSKIKRYVPEFLATMPFAEGIRRSLAWLDAHPESKKVDAVIDGEYEKVLEAWRRAMEAAG
jgi:nucleoside-diphosphate-sugar epimerase